MVDCDAGTWGARIRGLTAFRAAEPCLALFT